MNKDFTWIHSIWFISDGTKDYLAMLGKSDGRWVLKYRFRYYVDDKAHGSSDRKSQYCATMQDDSQASLANALGAIHSLIPVLEQQFGSKVEMIDLQCPNDDPKVFFELSSRPWAHVTIEPLGETA